MNIGEREVVGFGGNGEVIYVASVMTPFPDIRVTAGKGSSKTYLRWSPKDQKLLFLSQQCRLVISHTNTISNLCF